MGHLIPKSSALNLHLLIANLHHSFPFLKHKNFVIPLSAKKGLNLLQVWSKFRRLTIN